MRKNKIYLSAITLLLSSTLTIASDPSNDVENPFGVTSAKGMKYEALDIEIPSDTVETPRGFQAPQAPWYKNKKLWCAVGVCTTIVATTAGVTYAIINALSGNDEDHGNSVATISATVTATMSAIASISPSHRPSAKPIPPSCPCFPEYCAPYGFWTQIGSITGDTYACTLACGKGHGNLYTEKEYACCAGTPPSPFVVGSQTFISKGGGHYSVSPVLCNAE